MLKRFFITWVTHNSRYSERMKLYKVEKKEGFSKTFLNTDEHYEKAIDYTINNSEKHNIENIILLN